MDRPDRRKTLVGSVLASSGARMEKTVVVAVERLTKHPMYGKYVKKRVKYMAHDENNVCMPGDKVEIVETRPLSRRKRWRVMEIVEKAK
ncbi:MAG: 30S ribosomal protein S17 [Deltaproteobacteria bacterium]|nr:30S ribosomal protein S17 [Deltaproteobacteria bacterium]MBI5810293.1 30S ribosomal protein S17 [Deltaproteobacteria bacterium]